MWQRTSDVSAEGKTWDAERGSEPFPPLFLLQVGILMGAMQRKCSCGEAGGCVVLPVPPCVAGLEEQWESSGSVEGYFVNALAVELAQWEARDPRSERCRFGMPGCSARHGWCAPLQRRESSWRSVMLALHWSVQLALYCCSGLKKTPVLQGARATLPSVVLLCAAHYSESLEAPKVPGTGPGCARRCLSTPSWSGEPLSHWRVQVI